MPSQWEEELQRAMGAGAGVSVTAGVPVIERRVTDATAFNGPNVSARPLAPGEGADLDQQIKDRLYERALRAAPALADASDRSSFDARVRATTSDSRKELDEFQAAPPAPELPSSVTSRPLEFGEAERLDNAIAQGDYERRIRDPQATATFQASIQDLAADNRRGLDEYQARQPTPTPVARPSPSPALVSQGGSAGKPGKMIIGAMSGAAPTKPAQPTMDVRAGASVPPAHQGESLLLRAPAGDASPSVHPALIGLRDEGFRRAQDATRESRLLALLARAGGTAIGRGNEPGFAILDKNADAPMEAFRQEQAQEGAARNAQAAANDADPASPQSALARQLVGAVMPDLAKSPAFARASYAKIAANPVLEKLIGLQVEKMKAAAAAHERSQRDVENRQFQSGEHALNRAQSETNARIVAGQKEDARSEEQQKHLADDFDKAGVPGFYSRYGDAERILQEPGSKSDLPGVGPLVGRLPDLMVSKKGVDLRQAVGQMLAEYRKGITGAGMSDAERVEYGRITGLMQAGDEKAYRQGVERLKRSMDERVRSKAGGYRPDAVQRYAGRVPWFEGAMAPAKAGGAGEGALKPPAPGMVRIRDSKTGRTGWATPEDIPEGAEVVR